MPVEDESSNGEAAVASTATLAPSDAFGALGDETRLTVLETLLDADDSLTFTELFEATEADTTAGFAYHLRRLADHFVHGDEEDGYVLTYAGEQVARAIAAGTYTEHLSFPPTPTDDPCPFCEGELFARGTDGYVSIGCADCERRVLRLPLPPGAGERTPQGALDAFDRHHRRRLAAMTDGVCPECVAPVTSTVARPSERTVAGLPGGGDDADGDPAARRTAGERGGAVRGPVHLHLDCERCGCRMRCPVTLGLLDHPAVVSFYEGHGEDVRDRPLWNVGSEWREQVVSEEPWWIHVSTELDGERLSLLVDGELSVVETARVAA